MSQLKKFSVFSHVHSRSFVSLSKGSVCIYIYIYIYFFLNGRMFIYVDCFLYFAFFVFFVCATTSLFCPMKIVA